MPNTGRGIIYPTSSGHTRLWDHLQALATSADAAIGVVDAKTGSWQPYTPSLSGVTLGSGGTITGRYVQLGETIIGRVRVALGTGGAVTGTVLFGVPVTPADPTGEFAVGNGWLYDSSSGSPSRSAATVSFTGGPNLFLIADRFSPGTVTAGTPWAWAAGDTITAQFTYEAA